MDDNSNNYLDAKIILTLIVVLFILIMIKDCIFNKQTGEESNSNYSQVVSMKDSGVSAFPANTGLVNFNRRTEKQKTNI